MDSKTQSRQEHQKQCHQQVEDRRVCMEAQYMLFLKGGCSDYSWQDQVENRNGSLFLQDPKIAI